MGINYDFSDKSLLEQAFIHTSYAHENKMDLIMSNERLEFLGDAVLELAISSFLFDEYPELPEGELTKYRASLVCESSLSKKAAALDLGAHLMLGRGEEQNSGRQRDSILADAFEALIGAIFLDGGLESARRVLWDIFEDGVKRGYSASSLGDYKTYLQEIVQKTNKDGVRYEIIDERGPDHDKTFVARVFDGGRLLGQGEGRSKKDAEQSAAMEALKLLGVEQ